MLKWPLMDISKSKKKYAWNGGGLVQIVRVTPESCISLQDTAPMNFVKKIPFTLSLVFVNIAVFAIAFIMADEHDGPNWTITLLRFGAQFNPLTLDAQPYRIVTHMFLHGNIIHLGVNLYVLFYAGMAMEPIVGTKKLAFIYFVSGIAAAFDSLYWNLFTIGFGASGAIVGVLGFSLVYHIFFPGRSGKPAVILLIHFALFVSVNLFFPEWMYPDLAAQFGGVIAGIVMGFFSFAKGRESISNVKVEYVIIAGLVMLYFLMPRNQVRYFRFFRQVVDAEETTKRLLKEKLTDDDMRAFIKNYHHWEDILTRLDKQTNLPVALASDTFRLRKYIGLRKQENLFKKQVVQQEAYTYLDSVEYLERIMKQYMNLDYPLWSRVKMAQVSSDSSTRGMVKVFYDGNGLEMPGPPAFTYRVGRRDSLGRWEGVVREYYANGNIKMKGFYKRDIPDGVFLYYSKTQMYKETGRYADGKRFGKWQSFHPNGRLASEVSYSNGRFVHNLWDSLGNRLVVDGNGRDIERYPNGVVGVEGEYRYGVKEGDWYGRYPNGQLYFQEKFSEGRLVSGKSRSLDGKTFVYDESSLYPMPEGGFEKFHAYLKAKTSEVSAVGMGHVKLSFKVSANGVLADLVVEQSASPMLDEKAKEIVLKGPRWLPAREHGCRPVDSEGTLLIQFY